MNHKLSACVLIAAALAAFPSSASADDTRCVGDLFGTFDNVVVPKNAHCNLSFSVVKGNVKVLRRATVYSFFNRIAGNFEGEAPRWVRSSFDHIGGNFSVTGATGPGLDLGQGRSTHVMVCETTLPTGNFSIKESRNETIVVGDAPSLQLGCGGNNVARGNLLLQDNFIPAPQAMAVGRNRVGGNLQVFNNAGRGMKVVEDNSVSEGLQCSKNDQPFVGAPNFARMAEGQCHRAGALPSVTVSLVGDEDNFGYGGTDNPPCVFFDNAQAPDDVVEGVKTFDVTFVHSNGIPTVSWTHMFDLAGRAPVSATLQVREHFADPGHGATITIDGETQPFYASGGSQCGVPLIQTFAVPVGALADGKVEVTVVDPEPENFALDWAKLVVEGAVNRARDCSQTAPTSPRSRRRTPSWCRLSG